MKIEHIEDFAVLRKREYPPLEVFADALFHQSQGNPQLLDAYLEAVQAVKTKFPKPDTLATLRNIPGAV